MNYTESINFVLTEVKGLWPKWVPTDPQQEIWTQALAKCPQDDAKEALQQHYKSGKYAIQAPNLPDFISKLSVIRAGAAIGNKDRATVHTSHYVECIKAPEYNPALIGAAKGVFTARTSDQDDIDYVLRCGEVLRAKHVEIYGGEWILIEKGKIEDDNLRGKDAKAQAYKNVLNGEDTPGKKWLLGYIGSELKSNTLAGAFAI